jgi:hypothetical protein
MIPKTVIRYSWIYNKQFNPGFSHQDLDDLKQNCKEFERMYLSNIEKILGLIEMETGPWELKFIPIYIVKNHPSFSDPLTLQYHKDIKGMVKTLIHELVHNNVKLKFESSEKLHNHMNPIIEKVFNTLPLA